MVRKHIEATGIGTDLAVALHRIQAARQDGLGIGFDFERQRQRAQVERRFGAAEDAENLFAARNGMSGVQKFFSNLIIGC